MQTHREPAATVAARIPVALLALAIVVSALHASCTAGPSDAVATEDLVVDAGDDGGVAIVQVVADAGIGSPQDASGDSPSMDSPEDRSDGMSYGDGYGAPPADAGE
ncbi:MAG: hypothetical protein ACRENE_17135 [Polyangiaceae bacterium]